MKPSRGLRKKKNTGFARDHISDSKSSSYLWLGDDQHPSLISNLPVSIDFVSLFNNLIFHLLGADDTRMDAVEEVFCRKLGKVIWCDLDKCAPWPWQSLLRTYFKETWKKKKNKNHILEVRGKEEVGRISF